MNRVKKTNLWGNHLSLNIFYWKKDQTADVNSNELKTFC